MLVRDSCGRRWYRWSAPSARRAGNGAQHRAQYVDDIKICGLVGVDHALVENVVRCAGASPLHLIQDHAGWKAHARCLRSAHRFSWRTAHNFHAKGNLLIRLHIGQSGDAVQKGCTAARRYAAMLRGRRHLQSALGAPGPSPRGRACYPSRSSARPCRRSQRSSVSPRAARRRRPTSSAPAFPATRPPFRRGGRQPFR